MRKQTVTLIVLTASFWLWLPPASEYASRNGPHSGSRAAYAQAEPTATPDVDGIIYYIVQPGDTLSAIAFRHNVTIETLLALNNLSNSDFIVAGDRLIVGMITPEATEVPLTSTATRPPPTPTQTAVPLPPMMLCLTAFTDANKNGQLDGSEPLQAAVAFTVFDSTAVIANYVTDGLSEPFCIEITTPGEYQITRSVVPGEELTNSGNRTVFLNQGDVVQLQFGSIMGAEPTVPPAQPQPTARPLALTPTAAPSATATQTAPNESNMIQTGLIWLGVVIIVGLLFVAAAVTILFIWRPKTK